MKTLFDPLEKTHLEMAFEQFDAAHPQVWELFVQFAFRAIKKGYKRYGAKTIFEAIRYHCDIVTDDGDFKLNNNYTAYYARKFHAVFPNYKNFFETRQIKGKG